MPRVTFAWDKEAVDAMLLAATYKMFNLMDAKPVSSAVQFVIDKDKGVTGAAVAVTLEPRESK